MMWTTVVSSILLVMTIVDAASSEMNGAVPSILKPKISEFKTNIHHILEGARIRKKRQLEDSDPLDYKLKFNSMDPEDLPYLSNLNLTFWIPVNDDNKKQVLVGTTGGDIILFEIEKSNDKNAISVALSDEEDIAIKAKAFTHQNEEWFVILHYSERGYYIRLYQRIGRGLERRQKIDLTGFSDVELITMKGRHYLVSATYSATTGQGFTYQASVTLYHWAQTQFDAIASRVTYGARSVVCWSLDGSLYIAVAQETNDEANIQVGSPVFLYNSKEENRLVLWEMMATFGPSKVQHFYVAGNHYVVFIGKKDAVIYWWSNGQFLQWQSLMGTADASDVAVLSLGNGEVAIVIALKEEALFYTLDSSGYYIITFTRRIGVSSSLQFMFSGENYYALALYEELGMHSIWKLTVSPHYLPSVLSLDPLQQCLLSIKEVLAERQMELESIKRDSSRVWIKGSNQNITAKVIVKGRITSNDESRIRDVIIVRYAKVPDHSMSLVISAVTEAGDSSRDIKHQLEGVVLNGTRQLINGSKYFDELVFLPSLSMETISSDVSINDVKISRLQKYGLRKAGNQVFPNPTSVSGIYADKASVSNINGLFTDDFLLLHGKQTVTGSLTFSNVLASSVSVGTLNSIPFEDIITRNSPQDIKSIKKFSFLNSETIDVLGETNEVDLGSIEKKIATVDNYNEFAEHITFRSPLTVNGSLFLTGKLNKIVDVSRLMHQSVNRDFQQDLTGYFTFKGKQTITGDLLVGGSVNKIPLNNLLTVSSDQKMYADISFSNQITMAKDVIVDTVNGVDLSEQALTKLQPHQFIIGRKIFTQDITADFVDMNEYVTLDGVDPSLLVQDIVQHKQGVVKQNHTVFKDVDVLGNLTVLGTVNGLEIADLPFSLWLKSEQDIQIPIKANLLHLKNDLDVNTINNLDLNKDVVFSYTDEVIEAPKTFEYKTIFKSLKTQNGTLNGINLTSFKTKMEKYRNEGTVQGTKSLQTLEIHGDVRVTKLNELAFMDVMQPNAQQTVYGPVEFPSEVTTVLGNVLSNSIAFDVFNGDNLQDYFRNAVTLNHSKPIKNKQFEHLTANHLSVPHGSTISGISLHDMKGRVVTLNSPQLITAAKSFASTLNFTKLISVGTINGLSSSFFGEIVFTDEVSKIKNKNLLGNIHASNVLARGLINGIKIEEMAENVFYKSEDNVITQYFVFQEDIDVGDLYTPVLDGIDWKDLIFLHDDEFLETGWFVSKAYAERDVFATGLVNGCDLSEISSSLYTNKSDQIVRKNVNVHSILVVGNLKVNKKINQIPVHVLDNFITTTGNEVITSNAVIEANLIVDKLHIRNETNFNFAFIMQDAVRHSTPQVITGQKIFKGGMGAVVMAGGDIFVSKINGVDLEHLESTTVWKNGYYELSGDKIFPALFTDVAIVNGFINGLKLPEGVVKTDTSEHISHPTFFMSEVYASTELVVNGLIDGVDINHLIKGRVTLSSSQNITADLTLHDDAVMYDELTIDGTVNEVVLDLVAKVQSVQPLQGYKIFIEFYVSGPVTASSVNGYDVVQLSSKILRHDKDENINGVQVFEKPLRAQNSLYAEWINYIPIRQLMESFTLMMNNLKSAMEFMKDLTTDLQNRLVNQMSGAHEKASKFAYFTLHQEMDIGPTYKILYGYNLEHSSSEFSHSLLAWTSERHCLFMEKCCYLEFSYWLRAKKNGILMADSAAESGRYYPIHNESPVVSSRDFYIWTNATDSQSCSSSKDTRMTLLSEDQGLMEVFIDIENPSLLSDVKSFRKGNLYAVAGYYLNPRLQDYSNTVVYAYDDKRHWTEWQVLPSIGTLSMDIISYSQGHRHEVLLALGTGMNTDPPSYSTVYKWNNNERAFDFLQEIPSRYVTSTLWIRKGRDLLLSLAGVDYWPNNLVDCSELASGGQIDIYDFKGRLTWIQSIPVDGVVSTVSFSVDGDTYLAAASSRLQMIYIFEWKGYAGFVKIQSMSTEVRHLNIYNINNDIYMTVASVSSPSKILKMARRGNQLKTNSEFGLTFLEQKDEVPKEQTIVMNC